MIESASIHFAEPHAMTTNSPPSLPTYDDVAAAAGRLEGVAHRTPILRSRTADELLGAQLFFKCENLQRTGAFKITQMPDMKDIETAVGENDFFALNERRQVFKPPQFHSLLSSTAANSSS